MTMASVFELFNCKKFDFIHAFISSRQMVIVDDDAGGADGGSAVRGGRVESSFMYSCVSSA